LCTWNRRCGFLFHPQPELLAQLSAPITSGGENAEAYWSTDSKRLIFQSTRDDLLAVHLRSRFGAAEVVRFDALVAIVGVRGGGPLYYWRNRSRDGAAEVRTAELQHSGVS
jgi:hypothetical protein